MKIITTAFLTAAMTLGLIGCGAPANNAPATNTNTARVPPAAAAPTADALMALDKAANEAYAKGDSKFFETFLSDKFAMAGDKGKPEGKAEVVSYIAKVKCDVKSMDVTDPQMVKIDNDTYAFSYKATWDGTCNDGPGGKTAKIPSPVRGTSIYVRNGDKWQGAWHGETPIIEPKGDAKKDDAKKDDMKKDDAKKEEPKKAEPAKAADKTGDKADAAKPADKALAATAATTSAATTSAATDAKPAEMKPDPNTDALTKLHQSGWDAWREKDAKKLSDLTTASLAIVDPMGMWHSNRDEIVKLWTSEDCKGVTNAKVSDPFAFALSPTVEVLMLKGTADGTCMGEKNAPLRQTAVYVKEGEAWHLAFMFEQPAA